MSVVANPGASRTAGREFRAGFGSLRQGFSFVLHRPRLLVAGAIPPLITSLILAALLVTVWINADGIAVWATPFADEWGPGWSDILRMILAVLVFGVAVLLAVTVFTAATLALGAPLYDVISEAVEKECGGVANRVDYPARVWIPRMIGQMFVLLLQTMLVAVVVFCVGLIPIIGGVAAAVLGAVAGAVLITSELVTAPTERRGIVSLRERRRFLRSRQGLTLGFGIPVYILLSIPFLAVVVFPAAVAGATILTRRITSERLP